MGPGDDSGECSCFPLWTVPCSEAPGSRVGPQSHGEQPFGMGCLDGVCEQGWDMVGKEFVQFTRQWKHLSKLTAWSSGPTLCCCDCRYKKKEEHSKILHLHFLKADQMSTSHSSRYPDNINIIHWPHTSSWCKRLCLYREAAQDLLLYFFFLPPVIRKILSSYNLLCIDIY